jgi:hypothetical protein
MKKQNILLFILLPLLVQFCSNDKKNEAAPAGMVLISLSGHGKLISIFVPDTSTSKLSIEEQSSGELCVRSGRNFAIRIQESPEDLELVKQDIRADEVNKLKKIIRDEPTCLMWESEITKPEYHFLLNKTFGSTAYSFSNIDDPDFHNGQEQVEKMLNACQEARAGK